MSSGRVVVLAGATAIGAWVGGSEGSVAAVEVMGGLAAVALILGWIVGWRWAALCATTAVIAAVLALRSVSGLEAPRLGPMDGEIALVADPTPMRGGGVRAEARYRGKRVAVLAYQSAAAALDDRLAGELVTVRGRLSPAGEFELRQRHRHLTGCLRVDVITGWREGHGVSRLANDLRRALDLGAASLPARQRSLFTGLVLGDDRAQPEDLTAAFQAAGLAHVTAVSGQNVAFTLALVAPLLRRMRIGPRLVSTLTLLALFCVLTRAEPSVLRATAMAGMAAYGTAVGRPTTGLRSLGLAVVVLLLCDPLLVSSLGFRLSVAGAAGIVLASGALERRLPGPSWLKAPVAVTLAAQIAVAPFLVSAFGPVALVSVPANLLVAPAVGPVMAWGMSGGLVAGAVGGGVAAALHVPTHLLLSWIERVALAAERMPLAHLPAALTWMFAALGVALVLWDRARLSARPP